VPRSFFLSEAAIANDIATQPFAVCNVKGKGKWM